MSQVIEGFSNILNEKIVQLSVVGGILFYILAEPSVFYLLKTCVKEIRSQ